MAESAEQMKKAAEERKRQGMVDALKQEREGYVRRGLDDRVKQVDEQLKHYGAQAPKGRSTKPAETAASD